MNALAGVLIVAVCLGFPVLIVCCGALGEMRRRQAEDDRRRLADAREVSRRPQLPIKVQEEARRRFQITLAQMQKEGRAA